MLKLKEFRNATDKGIEEVAAELEISAATVSRHENENTKPNISDLEMWADYYGVHPAELFVGIKVCPPHLIQVLEAVDGLDKKDIEMILDMTRRFKESSAA